MKHTLSLIALVAAVPALAEGSREVGAHEHGVGELNIAIDANMVAMEFHAPGADIVGFEYVAKSDADLAAIDAAIVTLGAPLDLFVLPDAAGCNVTEVHVALESEDDHDSHGHDDHDDDHHDDHHDDHDEDGHDEDGHDEDGHDEDGHGDHDDDGHDEGGHGDDHHDDHDDHDGHDDDGYDDAAHTEFHAEYLLSCDAPEALVEIQFAYFEIFPNALEIDMQVITASGAQAYEVVRDDPKIYMNE